MSSYRPHGRPPFPPVLPTAPDAFSSLHYAHVTPQDHRAAAGWPVPPVPFGWTPPPLLRFPPPSLYGAPPSPVIFPPTASPVPIPFVRPPMFFPAPFPFQQPNMVFLDTRPPVSLQSEGGEDPFIIDWLRRVASTQQKPQSGSMKIPEVRSQLSRAVELLAELRYQHRSLSSSSSSSDSVADEWRHTMAQVELCKSELALIRAGFERSDCNHHLGKKLHCYRARRARTSRRRSEGRQKAQLRRLQADKATDVWLGERRESELQSRTERGVQLAAGGVLGGVTKKQTDIQTLLRLAGALGELRAFRREGGGRRGRGNSPLMEADEKFKDTLDMLLALLRQQAKVYKKEEHALRVLLEEEVKEKMRTAAEDGKAEVWAESGVQGAESHCLLLPPHQQFYEQASASTAALVAIRSEWDKFLSSEGTPIPSATRLQAPPPSNTLWEQYCTSTDA